MEWSFISVLVFALGIIAAGVIWSRRTPRGKTASPTVAADVNPGVQPAVPIPQVAPREPSPDSLVVGESVDRPFVTVKKSADLAVFEGSRSEPMQIGALARLTSVLQAVPSLLVANEGTGKRLMEVVINGELTPAAGGGLRAFATEGGKIVEHAKLFDAGKLQNMVNAAVVWQVASVLVAQKHLADISQKLTEIKASLDQITAFQYDERRSAIKGTYEYLSQIAQSIQQGQLSPDARAQLESCERQLLQIQDHLFADVRKAVEKKVEDPDFYGSEGLYKGIDSKIDGLDDLVADMELCLCTRIGAWHVLSAYPGESALIQVRRASVEKSVHELRGLARFVEQKLEPEIAGLTARLTSESKLQARRELLRSNRDRKKADLIKKAQKATRSIESSMQALMLQHQPTRILLEINGGQIVAARQALAATQ
jgi:hypothetical protein